MDKEVIEQLEQVTQTLERISSDPLALATILGINDGQASIMTSGGHYVITAEKEMRAGDRVLVYPKTNQYVRKAPLDAPGVMTNVLDTLGTLFVVEHGGSKRLVPAAIDDVNKGDRVLLDPLGAIILSVLPREKETFSAALTGVSWDDIGGNYEAKEALIEALELPLKHPDLYAKYGKQITKGILLVGPPGCGKTMLGKAAATSLNAIDGFIYCKGPEVLDPYVGVAEATVRSLFQRAREFKRRTGRHAIIFIDEADALLGTRPSPGDRANGISSTLVPQFLSEMDGLDEAAATVLLSTNLPQHLDPAVVRDGRVDRKISVSRPTFEESFDIASKLLRTTPLHNFTQDELAAATVSLVWSTKFNYRGEERNMHQYVSGSLIAGILEKAKSAAMKRDLTSGEFTGVCAADLVAAIAIQARELGTTALTE